MIQRLEPPTACSFISIALFVLGYGNRPASSQEAYSETAVASIHPSGLGFSHRVVPFNPPGSLFATNSPWSLDSIFGTPATAFSGGSIIGDGDSSLADNIFFWMGDTTPGTHTYDAIYYLDVGAPFKYWARVTDASVVNVGAAVPIPPWPRGYLFYKAGLSPQPIVIAGVLPRNGFLLDLNPGNIRTAFLPEMRPRTLLEIKMFPSSDGIGLLGGTTAATSDLISIWNLVNQDWEEYFYNTTLGHWAPSAQPTTNSNSVTVSGNTPFLVTRRASNPAVTLTFPANTAR